MTCCVCVLPLLRMNCNAFQRQKLWVAEIGTGGLGAWSAAVARNVGESRRYIGGNAHYPDHLSHVDVTNCQQQNMYAIKNCKAA